MRIIRRIIRCMRRLPCIWSIIRYLALPAKKGIYSIYTAYTGVYANSCHITANHVLVVYLVILQCPKQPLHNYSLNKMGATVLCTADALSFYSGTKMQSTRALRSSCSRASSSVASGAVSGAALSAALLNAASTSRAKAGLALTLEQPAFFR